jgi:nucleolar protein 56
VKIVNDNALYARVAKFVKNKANLTDDSIKELSEIVDDEAKAQRILDASRSSMGTDISDIDLINIENFADRVISLMEFRKNLYAYLTSKMHIVAPNLSSLIGEVVGARLISHAGSLTNLSKYPASTVQILGAEKALFRALKTRGNTPKYGLIYHSSFIGKAAQKNKGRISRFLANKCSIASRIDCFSDANTTTYGEMMREQVEERLKFYESGDIPRKNADVMSAAFNQVASEEPSASVEQVVPEKSAKRKITSSDEMDVDEQPESPKKSKKAKKSKVSTTGDKEAKKESKKSKKSKKE